jgi:hypothetical protein
MCSWTMLVVGLQMIAGLVVLCSYFRCGAENTYQLGTWGCTLPSIGTITGSRCGTPLGLIAGTWYRRWQTMSISCTSSTPTSWTRLLWEGKQCHYITHFHALFGNSTPMLVCYVEGGVAAIWWVGLFCYILRRTEPEVFVARISLAYAVPIDMQLGGWISFVGPRDGPVWLVSDSPTWVGGHGPCASKVKVNELCLLSVLFSFANLS